MFGATRTTSDTEIYALGKFLLVSKNHFLAGAEFSRQGECLDPRSVYAESWIHPPSTAENYSGDDPSLSDHFSMVISFCTKDRNRVKITRHDS